MAGVKSVLFEKQQIILNISQFRGKSQHEEQKLG